MLSRGDEKRNALLSDFFSYPLNNDDIGPDLVTALVVQCSKNTTRTAGRSMQLALGMLIPVCAQSLPLVCTFFRVGTLQRNRFRTLAKNAIGTTLLQ